MEDQISKAGVNDLIISMYEVIEEECNEGTEVFCLFDPDFQLGFRYEDLYF